MFNFILEYTLWFLSYADFSLFIEEKNKYGKNTHDSIVTSNFYFGISQWQSQLKLFTWPEGPLNWYIWVGSRFYVASRNFNYFYVKGFFNYFMHKDLADKRNIF